MNYVPQSELNFSRGTLSRLNKDIMNLKNNLKILLAEADMTAAELSRRTSIPKNTLSSWLSGSPPKNLNQVKAVADCLGVTIDKLIYGTPGKSRAGGNLIEEHMEEINAGVFEVILRRKK